jgi:hypothetical protein
MFRRDILPPSSVVKMDESIIFLRRVIRTSNPERHLFTSLGMPQEYTKTQTKINVVTNLFGNIYKVLAGDLKV